MNKESPLGLKVEDPLGEESVAIEKLFEDVHRRDRVLLDAAFEPLVDQPVSEAGVFGVLFAVKKDKSKSNEIKIEYEV